MNVTLLTVGQEPTRDPAIPRDVAALPELSADWLTGGTVVLNQAGEILDANEAFITWCGLAAEGPRGQGLAEVLALRFEEWKGPLAEFLARTSAFEQLQLCANTAGRKQWFSLELARHGGITFVRLESVLPPLSELEECAWDEHMEGDAARRQMFIRLVSAESQLNRLMRRWPGVVFNQRADFSFHFVSPKIEEMTGIPSDQWRSGPQLFWQVVHEADAEELQQHLRRVARTTHGVTSTYRIRHAKTGRVAYIMEHRRALMSDAGLLLGFEGVWLDVTRQTVAEKRLSSAAWKETLALLTMGLAHDFSNIMAGILSLSEAFQAQVEKDHPFHEGLALIKQNSKQASQLVQRILNLHRGRVGERNYYNLNELVADTVELVRKVVPRRIDIRTELAPESLPLYLDPVEFRQVFINLTLNAVDAMPQGGRIIYRTALHLTPLPLANCLGTLPRVPCISLSVEDSGTGISPRNLASIFDPFFTTKALNKGSGLGLYNTRLFVEKHEGAVGVESVERTKTIFTICLPQADFTEAEKLHTQQAVRRHTLLLQGARGSALDKTAEFLRVHNYYVVVASTAESAQELLRSPDYQFSGAMLMLTQHEPDQVAVFRGIREQSLPLKTILQIVGGNQDEVDTQVLNAADLVITSDTSSPDLTTRLRNLLEGNPPANL